jgi:hypothetical protein
MFIDLIRHCHFNVNGRQNAYSTEGRVILWKRDNFGPVYEDEIEKVGTGCYSLW